MKEKAKKKAEAQSKFNSFNNKRIALKEE